MREALDCWVHGVAHLMAEFGREQAVGLMAQMVFDIHEHPRVWDVEKVRGDRPGPEVA